MKIIEITAPFVRIEGGILKLSKQQADAREHQLEKIEDAGDDVYKLKGETHFIEGEIIGLDGEISPAFANEVKVVDDASPVGSDGDNQKPGKKAKGKGGKKKDDDKSDDDNPPDDAGDDSGEEDDQA